MQDIFVLLPVVISTLVLVFYLISSDRDKHIRLIPIILGCLAIESLFVLLHPDFVKPYIAVFPYSLLLLFFLYENLRVKILPTPIVALCFLPSLILIGLFLLVPNEMQIGRDLQSIFLVKINLVGILLSIAFFFMLYPSITKENLKPYKKSIVTSILFQSIIYILIQIVVIIQEQRAPSEVRNSSFYLLQFLKISLSITFYLYLFNRYKLRLQKTRNERLKIIQPAADPNLEELTKEILYTQPSKSTIGNEHNSGFERYGSSQLRPDVREQHADRIHKFFLQEDKPYLDLDFNLDYLSKETKIQKPYLSQVFNAEIGKPFNQYVNEKRIQHACEILKADRSISVSELSESCGYRSRTTFYQQFRKQTGVSVQEFINNI